MTKYKVKESFFNNKNKGLLNNLNILTDLSILIKQQTNKPKMPRIKIS